MELQTIYLHSAIVICGFLTGISSESKETQDTDPFDKDHYDKEHPLVISATHISIDSITIGWEMPENMANYTSQLNNFVVYYHKRAQKGNYTIATVPANASSYMIGNLDAGTRYSLYVAANYSTGQDLASHTFIYKTLGYGGPANPCTCHHLGSKDNNCDPMTGKCNCKGEGYVDLRCEKCKSTYYWHTRLACQKCPNCNLNNSNGSCYVDRVSSQVLCRCHKPWGGHNCEHCGTGYFMDAPTAECKPCVCNNNSKNKSNLCHFKTGVCTDCQFNTTGDHCEKCLPDFEGDAVVGRNCSIIKPVALRARKGGVVVGVCVALFIIVIVIVSVGLCQRMRGKKPQFNFWTVELKDDHEQVNFSQMMEQNDYNNGDLYMDDVMQYHDRAAIPATTPTHERPPLYRPNRPKMQGPYQTLEDRHREIC